MATLKREKTIACIIIYDFDLRMYSILPDQGLEILQSHVNVIT